MLKRKVWIIIFFTLAVVNQLYSQSGKIQIINANTFELEQRGKNKVKKLIGDVQLKQDNTTLKCDSAYLFDETNFVEAYRHVQIIHQDSVNFWGDILKYDGNTKIAKLQKNVVMQDPNSTLSCDELEFDLSANRASYFSGGKITSGQLTLTSQIGYYFTKSRELFFRKNVVLVSPDFTMQSDTLKYNTQSRLATFYSKTIISSADDTIYCNLGTYQTDKQTGILRKKVKIRSKENTLFADTVLYDRKNKHSKALGNLLVIDTINKVIITGDVGETFGIEKRTYVTKNSFVFNLTKTDTLIISADSIWVYQRNINAQKEMIKAYKDVKIYKSDLQAICDSLVYNRSDSLMYLYKNPVIWSDENQITGDTVLFYIVSNQIDSMNVFSNAFVISKETNKHYNQVKGRNLQAKFIDKKINNIEVYGNGQSIYYAKDDSLYVGVNVINCSEMKFLFAQGKMSSINFIGKPDAKFYPINYLKDNELKLKGFVWRKKMRPTRLAFKYNISILPFDI
ncbi:MAG: hypothetical protein IT246_00965 [Bacteroidia bacterium]|nr:hypothetical protein [Bacteroidia bacterium]